MKKKVIVIGAGVAGLASAIRLQHAGYDVELFEKEGMPGGKMHRIEQDGFKFDLGPTIVMMPELYREVFEFYRRRNCGESRRSDSPCGGRRRLRHSCAHERAGGGVGSRRAGHA